MRSQREAMKEPERALTVGKKKTNKNIVGVFQKFFKFVLILSLVLKNVCADFFRPLMSRKGR